MAEKEAKELEALKRLMILLLYKLGSSSDEIAAALEVAPSAIRTLVPSRGVKRIAKPIE
jgi:DNA-directed RNA polymerase specialized sigma24 family protein